jgi:hypothetical protein
MGKTLERERKLKRGSTALTGRNSLTGGTDSLLEQGPEGGQRLVGGFLRSLLERAPRRKCNSLRWKRRKNAKREIPWRRVAGPSSEGKPLESEIPWALPA